MKRKLKSTAMLHDDDGVWALSYGDMITLLLAFFILFFSVDHSKENQEDFVRALYDRLSAKEMVNAPNAANTDLSLIQAATELSDLGASVSHEGKKIVVDFPKTSFFSSGDIKLNTLGVQVLGKFVELYTPFAGKSQLHIVGFTDAEPVSKHNPHARDNLELSILRALSAQRYLRDAGIPMEHMRLGGFGVLKELSQLGGGPDLANPETMAHARKIVLVIEAT